MDKQHSNQLLASRMNISQQQLSETILRLGPYLRTLRDDLEKGNILRLGAEIYIQSAPNNSNETHTFMCLGRAGCFGQH